MIKSQIEQTIKVENVTRKVLVITAAKPKGAINKRVRVTIQLIADAAILRTNAALFEIYIGKIL